MVAMVDFNARPLLALKRRFRGEDTSWNRNQQGSRPDFGESNCNREGTACGLRGACNWCEYPVAIRNRVEFCPVLAVPAPMRCETATAVRVSAASRAFRSASTSLLRTVHVHCNITHHAFYCFATCQKL